MSEEQNDAAMNEMIQKQYSDAAESQLSESELSKTPKMPTKKEAAIKAVRQAIEGAGESLWDLADAVLAYRESMKSPSRQNVSNEQLAEELEKETGQEFSGQRCGQYADTAEYWNEKNWRDNKIPFKVYEVARVENERRGNIVPKDRLANRIRNGKTTREILHFFNSITTVLNIQIYRDSDSRKMTGTCLSDGPDSYILEAAEMLEKYAAELKLKHAPKPQRGEIQFDTDDVREGSKQTKEEVLQNIQPNEVQE